MLESLNCSFRNPKNIIWVIYRIKQLRNYNKKKHGVLRGPQFGKQRLRARLGISGVKLILPSLVSKTCPKSAEPINRLSPSPLSSGSQCQDSPNQSKWIVLYAEVTWHSDHFLWRTQFWHTPEIIVPTQRKSSRQMTIAARYYWWFLASL